MGCGDGRGDRCSEGWGRGRKMTRGGKFPEGMGTGTNAVRISAFEMLINNAFHLSTDNYCFIASQQKID